MHIGNVYEFQSAIFQPIGGMDMISKAIPARGRAVSITFNAKVTTIRQDIGDVTATYGGCESGGSRPRRPTGS